MATILVVDDNQSTLFTIERVIRKSTPHEVICCQSGEEALKLVAEHKPDVILLDVSMPGMDGFEVCQRLKEQPDTAGIPVLFLTALYEDATSRVKGLELGADDYINQPVSNAELLARIGVALRIKEAEEEAVRSQRMAAIGEIAITVRHEINNPLAALLGNVQLLLQESDNLPEDIRRRLEVIEEMVLRISEVMKRLDKVQDETIVYGDQVSMLDLGLTATKAALSMQGDDDGTAEDEADESDAPAEQSGSHI